MASTSGSGDTVTEATDSEQIDLTGSSSDTQDPLEKQPSEPTIIDRLKCPTRSDLSRKRKVETHPETLKKHRAGVVNPTDPKNISAAIRVKEFPDECLTVRSGKLFCLACREEIALKKSTVKNHISSGDKHSKAKQGLAKKQARERDIAESLRLYDKEVHPTGSSTVSMDTRVYRVRVVEQFLKCGIPLAKVDRLRSLLEEGACRLTHSSHLADYIPVIQQQEKSKIRNAIDGKDVSVFFDGSSRLGEALAIVIRFTSGWSIQQRIIRLSMLAKSVTSEELAREVLTSLSTELGVAGNCLLASIHDRAAVNNAAMRTISIMYPSLMDIGCFAHTLDHVGGKFDLPTLNKFMKYWETMFKHSHKSKLLWREQTGVAIKSYSPTRWWSRWECMKQVMEHWGDVEVFIRNNAEVAPKSREKIGRLFLTQSGELKIELAVNVDAGEAFVKATYSLESDGPLALQCYEILTGVRTAIQVRHWPNTAAIARKVATPDKTEQNWMDYATSCVQPGLDYYESKFDGDLLPAVNAFKSARLFNPGKLVDLKPDATTVDTLRAFPFLNNDQVINNLKSELSTYLALVDGVPRNMDPLQWWERNESELPYWSQACKRVILCQPSSGAVERVFSILRNHFNDHQNSSLEDYVESAVMLQYNYKD